MSVALDPGAGTGTLYIRAVMQQQSCNILDNFTPAWEVIGFESSGVSIPTLIYHSEMTILADCDINATDTSFCAEVVTPSVRILHCETPNSVEAKP